MSENEDRVEPREAGMDETPGGPRRSTGRPPSRAGCPAGPRRQNPRRRRSRRSPSAPSHGRGRRQPGAARPRRAAHPARSVRGTSRADRLLLHVEPRAARGRAARRLHLLHQPGRRAVLPALPRHHLRGSLPAAHVVRGAEPHVSYPESVRYRDSMGWDVPWYSA